MTPYQSSNPYDQDYIFHNYPSANPVQDSYSPFTTLMMSLLNDYSTDTYYPSQSSLIPKILHPPLTGIGIEQDSYSIPPIPTDSFGIAVLPPYYYDNDYHQGDEPPAYEAPIYYPDNKQQPPDFSSSDDAPYPPPKEDDPAYKISVTVRNSHTKKVGNNEEDSGFLRTGGRGEFPKFDKFFNEMIQGL